MAWEVEANAENKSSKRRFVLPEIWMKALEVYRLQSEFNGAGDFIFPNSVGGPLEPGNFRKRVLYPAMDELGIMREDRKFGFHILRHSSATVLHEEFGDIEVAQRALGHARRSTTEDIYDHAEIIVNEEIVGMLLSSIVGDGAILQRSDLVS